MGTRPLKSRKADPQCYIGKKRLDKAIQLYQKTYPGAKHDVFTVSWLPFYLDPAAPTGPLLERFAQRFGDRAPAMQQRLAALGHQEGIAFSFAGTLGPTKTAHRLIHLAAAKGPPVQNAVVLALFERYFEGDADITAPEALVEVGVAGGLDRSEAQAWLASGAGGAEVDAQVAAANARGIRGVPHFTINDYEVDGAQEPQDFMAAFVKVKEAERT
jgi:predicted DsbA family dithiol-disulfide isomerase